ncbi:MAG TPA: TlpA disulfide reductase family protein [Chloroflexota bacterium]|jgi:cytochrome c biogenesis protein CcmG/thiol:disulfide interchange protein DsbE|nr:TlpA disulfide reductase family protein [Chloroflexota bacterium]
MLRRITIAGVWILLGGLLALLAWGLFRATASDASVTGALRVNWEGKVVPLRARPAPELRVVLLGADQVGGELDLAALRGQPVVVNFWASWCQPCRDEAAVLERFAAEYGPRGVAFVGVNVWDSADRARAFVDEFGLSYPNGTDARGSAAIDYGLTGLPETYFLDRQGQIVGKFVGPLTERALRTAVESLLS